MLIRSGKFFAFFSLALIGVSSSAFAQMDTSFTDGALRVGESTTTCDGDAEGAIRWNDTDGTFEMCDGDDWKLLVGQPSDVIPSEPEEDVGYFVVTSGNYWTRNDGTPSAAINSGVVALLNVNENCLTNLNANDWMGKADATSRGLLTSNNVQAFLCTTTYCQNPLAGATYAFAVSGDNTKGGATFVTDSDGHGPSDSNNWSGSTYFGSTVTYWTGRTSGGGTATVWGDTTNNWATCQSWIGTGGSGFQAVYGTSNSTNAGRWASAAENCMVSASRRLICMVHP